jgi:serine/threonine protein phosphatase PrpC
MRVLSEHPVKEHKDIFAGGRLFGETPVTRCMYFNFRLLKALPRNRYSCFFIAFGDSFYKLDDTDYTEYVFGSSKLPSKRGVMSYNMKMKSIYPLIRSAPYLTARPEVTVHERSRLDQFMVIASDGVWAIEPVSNDWVVQVVSSAIARGDVDPAEVLMQEVKGFNPGDDVTIQVVKF